MILNNPKPNSKRSQEKRNNPRKINVIGCKICHATNIQLIKGPDSYYCKFCYNKVLKKRKIKE